MQPHKSAQHLEGAKILLCRPTEKVEALRKKLEGQGARVWIFSPFECHPLPINPEIHQSLEELEQFDWLTFGSAQGVDFFYHLWKGLKSDRIEGPSSVRVGVVGKKTEKKFSHFFPAWPVEIAAENLQDLLEGIKKRQEKGKREGKILNITSVQSLEKIFPTLPEGLEMERLPIYSTVSRSPGEDEKKEILSQFYHLALFGSPSCFDFFVDLLGRDAFSRIQSLSALGQTTKKYLEEQGVKVEVVPSSPQEESFFEAVIDFWKHSTGAKE